MPASERTDMLQLALATERKERQERQTRLIYRQHSGADYITKAANCNLSGEWLAKSTKAPTKSLKWDDGSGPDP